MSSAAVVAPSPSMLPSSPLYQIQLYPGSTTSGQSHASTILSASPFGATARLKKAREFEEERKLHPDDSIYGSASGPVATSDAGTFPLSPVQLPSDLAASDQLQLVAQSMSQLDQEQKFRGKEKDSRSSALDESKMRESEHEGKDGPAQTQMDRLFTYHAPSIVMRQQRVDTVSQDVDIRHHQRTSEARESLMSLLELEQAEEMKELALLTNLQAPDITLPSPSPLPSLPSSFPEAPFDDSLLHRVRPSVPQRFSVPVSAPEVMPLSPRISGGHLFNDANASLFSSALELSALSSSVPDLPDLPDYSDITLPLLPDIPEIPEPTLDDSNTTTRVTQTVTLTANASSSAPPAQLNVMPASVVYSVGGVTNGAQSAQLGLAPPPRPARPNRLSQGAVQLPSAQKLNIHAPPPRSSFHAAAQQSQSAQNAALNAALRTTLSDISDEQLEQVLANK